MKVATTEEIDAALRESGAAVVADLSLGSARAHSVAHQLLGQLGIEPKLPRPSPPAGGPGSGTILSYGQIIDQHVDAEAKGDTAMIMAFAHAKQLQARGVRAAAVFAPRFGLPWAREDEAFLEFAAALGIRVALIECDAAPEADPLQVAAAVPGVLDHELTSRFDLDRVHHLRLPSGAVLIGPESRRQPATAHRLVFDRLGEIVSDDDDLQAFAQLHGSNLYVDAGLLTRQAWRNFAAGGAALALQMVEKAAACASSPAQRAALLCQVQGMRIASGQWEAGAAVDDPPDSLPAPLRQFLLEAKGWSMVMSNRPIEAIQYVDRACRMGNSDDVSREKLYLLNIRALCCFRLNEFDEALALEKQIEAGLEELTTPSWPLLYVNAINQARLYRRVGDLDRAAEYYERAFTTTLGARTESDCFYANVCIARIDEDRGRTGAALAAWIRASLHWCAATLPEAVSTRVLGAVLPRVPESPFAYDEAVAAALLAHVPPPANAPHEDVSTRFLRADRLEGGQGKLTAVHGADGWSVLAYRGALEPERRNSPSLQMLRSRLRAWITRETQSVEEPDAFVVDDRAGCEVATNEMEVLETALRHGVDRIVFNGIPVDPTNVRHRAILRIAPQVARIERPESGTAQVSFKRYLAARNLNDEELALVSRAETGEILDASAARSMERRDLVVMRMA